MKPDDPRSRRSREALLAALTDRLDQNPDAVLSISTIVEHAGVTRPTFYQHFKDVPGALQQAAMARLVAAFPEPLDLSPTDDMTAEERVEYVATATEPLFVHLMQHNRFYWRILDSAGTFGFFDELVAFVAGRMLSVTVAPVAESTQTGQAEHDRATFAASGALWLVMRWLASDFAGENSPARMARRVDSLTVRHLIP